MEWPPDFVGELERRRDLYQQIADDPIVAAGAWNAYSDDPVLFINDCCWVVEPRNASRGDPTMLPVVPFKRQAELIEWMRARLDTTTSGYVTKSRDSGATWMACALGVWLWLFRPGSSVGFGSLKAASVDLKGDGGSIFEKVRTILRNLPPRFLPPGFTEDECSNYMRVLNPSNGASLVGSSGENIGRGGRTSLFVLDEAAHIPHAESVEAALTANSDCRISISTPRNASLFDAQIKTAPPEQVFRFRLEDAPWHTEEWIAQKKDELERAGLGHLFAQEYLMVSTAGLPGQLIKAEWVDHAIDAYEKLGIEPTGQVVCALDVADGGRDRSATAVCLGVHLLDVESRGDCRADEAARWCWEIAGRWNAERLMYDSIGVGAGAGGAFRTIQEHQSSGPSVYGWSGSGEVLDPHEDYVEGRSNRDMFANRKSQAWWSLRDRFENTYRLVNGDDSIDPDEIISIDSEVPELAQLRSELLQITYGHNSAGKIVIDKAPQGSRSPNLGDAVMMAFAPSEDRNMPIAFARAMA